MYWLLITVKGRRCVKCISLSVTCMINRMYTWTPCIYIYSIYMVSHTWHVFQYHVHILYYSVCFYTESMNNIMWTYLYENEGNKIIKILLFIYTVYSCEHIHTPTTTTSFSGSHMRILKKRTNRFQSQLTPTSTSMVIFFI